VVDMAHLCDGEVIYYAKDSKNACIQAHLKQQGRAVFFLESQVIMALGTHQQVLLKLDFPAIAKQLTDGTFHAHTLLASVAVAWALDLSPELIRAGLKNFGQPAALANREVARKKPNGS
ncbi:MAG: cyanophycin synthetase, partial [Limnohabitans sp.]